mmetsp:Transcript_1010/g.1421  ORF Transcript_1010/g.1421 Transcript_1010/m.1421 type:complete len:245 (-) Transcript_1010:13-747(-)
MTISCQDTTGLCPQRENVTGSGDVGVRSFGVGEQLDRLGTIDCTDSSCDALFFCSINRYRECCLLGIFIVDYHGRQFQFIHPFTFHSTTDYATRVADNLCHGFWRTQVGGHNQVTLILPIHIINDNNHFTLGNRRNCIFHRLPSKAISRFCIGDNTKKFFLSFCCRCTHQRHFDSVGGHTVAFIDELFVVDQTAGMGFGWKRNISTGPQHGTKVGMIHSSTLCFQIFFVVWIGLFDNHGTTVQH